MDRNPRHRCYVPDPTPEEIAERAAAVREASLRARQEWLPSKDPGRDPVGGIREIALAEVYANMGPAEAFRLPADKLSIVL